MKKILFGFMASAIFISVTRAEGLSKPIQVKKMSIQVKADAFTATTFIEMEFYNPDTTASQALYRFELEPGQAITGFQLDLSGKFRDGSIEEKWKAANAYSTITGQRMDPALLQMDYSNHYSLRVYPVPANGTRRVTMTIQQLLTLDKHSLLYHLPLRIMDALSQLNIGIRVNNCPLSPYSTEGLLAGESFVNDNDGYKLSWNAFNTKAELPVSFVIPMPLEQPVVCTKEVKGKTFFAIRLRPAIQRDYPARPKKITVFWDISLSGAKRNIDKEISFLKEYVSTNAITQLTLIPFNQEIRDTAVFYTENNFNSRWVDYLKSLNYEGATQLGLLNFSRVEADAILLFSDGNNSFGKSMPVRGFIPVYCIHAVTAVYKVHLEKIIGASGGRDIDLYETDASAAVEMAGKTRNGLINISSPGGHVIIDQDPDELRGYELLITGSIEGGSNTMLLDFGNNDKVQANEKIILGTGDQHCDGSSIERIPVLSVFDSYITIGEWKENLEFGKTENIVTRNTSFIVLEKIEDYIKFNIRPPKELEPECDMNSFVKADEERKRIYQQASASDVFLSVANAYNDKIYWWNKDQPLISPDELKKEAVVQVAREDQPEIRTGVGLRTGNGNSQGIVQNGDDKALGEVIVTAMGQTRRPTELGYSVSVIRRPELVSSRPVNMANGLTGKVSGLNVQTVNNGVFADTRITLRGIRSLTGNNEPMLILDGVPISLRLISSINPNDILNVTVLKSSSATAIYGPDGVNGALVVTSRKGSWFNYYSSVNRYYKLENCEDVDYLEEIKAASRGEKLSTYYILKPQYAEEPGFYFDMAQYLYKMGYRKEAITILFSAADLGKGNPGLLRGIGYTLETWKEFDRAIGVYRELLLLNKDDLYAYRDLALAYFQNRNYQQAIDVFYEGVLENENNDLSGSRNMRAIMLQEMNMIISMHADSVDISKINKALIRPLPVDLRITLDCNNRDLHGGLSVLEPDGKTSLNSKEAREGRGRLNSDGYYDYHINAPEEYQVKNAAKGKYRIMLHYYDSWYGNTVRIPTIVKITSFKNFGRPNQEMLVENVIMDNQDGVVEIGEIVNR